SAPASGAAPAGGTDGRANEAARAERPAGGGEPRRARARDADAAAGRHARDGDDGLQPRRRAGHGGVWWYARWAAVWEAVRLPGAGRPWELAPAADRGRRDADARIRPGGGRPRFPRHSARADARARVRNGGRGRAARGAAR